jgi:hypothetical protein
MKMRFTVCRFESAFSWAAIQLIVICQSKYFTE